MTQSNSSRFGTRHVPNGFTLVELLIVSSLVVLVMLSISSLFMTVLLGNARTNVKRQIKAEGNEVIDKLEFYLREAKSVTDAEDGTSIACSAAGTARSFSDYPDGINIINVQDVSVNIQYDTATRQLFINTTPADPLAVPQPLNTTYAIVQSTPQITCYSDSNTNKTAIKIDFRLGKTVEENGSTLQERFTAHAQLRNS